MLIKSDEKKLHEDIKEFESRYTRQFENYHAYVMKFAF